MIAIINFVAFQISNSLSILWKSEIGIKIDNLKLRFWIIDSRAQKIKILTNCQILWEFGVQILDSKFWSITNVGIFSNSMSGVPGGVVEPDMNYLGENNYAFNDLYNLGEDYEPLQVEETTPARA